MLSRARVGAASMAQHASSSKARALSHVAAADLLHSSTVPTFYYQDSLPRLPIPTLNETLDKYLYFLEPIVSAEQLAGTRKHVEGFRSGVGQQLQTHLQQWDKEHPGTSYISEMWYDMYLTNRDALPLNLNPQLTWRDDPVPSKNEQATKAANLVHTAVRFHLTLEQQRLQPDVFHTKPGIGKHPALQWAIANVVPRRFAYYPMYLAGGYALDMSQYPRLFKSTRVPKAGKDELRTAATARHIVVQRGPRFYTVEVLTDKGLVPASVVESALRAILADSAAVRSGNAASYAAEPPVGALTGASRDEWARARQAMEKSPVNAATLAAIDSALFVLTLDDAAPTDHATVSRAMLHGDLRNRWFDKCFNIIVAANGKAGISWEHAWGDGAAILYFFNEVHRAVTALPARADTASAPAPVTRLQWDLSDAGVVAAIRAAEAASDAVVGATALKVYQTDALTKADIKRSKVSPDGVMQMAMQLAHWRAHGTAPCTYESASTAAFKHGRTETIRPTTPESVAMCRAFSDAATAGSSAGHTARFEALSKAAARHRKTTMDAVMGKGVDRHMFALGKWAERLQLPGGTPAVFTDPNYAHFKDIRLSTSTLESEALDGGGFGPVSRTSYGVGYGIEARGAHFHIMSYTGTTTSNDAFEAGVESALRDINLAINAAKTPDSSKVVK